MSYSTVDDLSPEMQSVLIADDNPTLLRTLKLALEAAGYRVQLAQNGAQALALQRADPAEVLITDIFMPDCDGFEAIEKFRRHFPATKIVAMSGDAQHVRREFLSAAELIGVDATLRKPFNVENLLDTLRSL